MTFLAAWFLSTTPIFPPTFADEIALEAYEPASEWMTDWGMSVIAPDDRLCGY